VPRTQITAAQLNRTDGTMSIGGPFTPDDHETPLTLDVVIVQGGAYAHGQTSALQSLKGDRWVVTAKVVGDFDLRKQAQGFGTLISVDRSEPAAAIQQTFTWTELVDVDHD